MSWIAKELETASLGDGRLRSRFGVVLDRLSSNPGVSIPAACTSKSETEATYRLFRNPRVTVENILKPHQDATLKRAALVDVAIVPQDSTEIDLTRPNERLGGPLDGGDRRGFLDHALVAFEPNGVPLGVVAATIWQRPEVPARKVKKSASRPFKDKESYRWLQGYEATCEFKRQLPEGKRVVSISDSEGDIYECLVAAAERERLDPKSKANYIIRACQDRRVADESELLFDAVASTPILGRYTLEVRERPAGSFDDRKRKQAREARIATITIRAAQVQLESPSGKEKLPRVVVNAVLLREELPPEGQNPIEWLLLTDLPITTSDEIEAIIRYYICRWQIEVYFRVLKGGCKIEDLQLETSDRLMPCIALYMIVAWRLLYLTMLARNHPELPSDAVFEDSEWQSVYAVSQKKAPPSKSPPLGEFLRMVASLGGFVSRNKGAHPGVKTVWIGLQRMKDIAFGWEARAKAEAKGGAG